MHLSTQEFLLFLEIEVYFHIICIIKCSYSNFCHKLFDENKTLLVNKVN